MGIANYIDRNAAKEENFDSWRVRTRQRVQEDAEKWRNAASTKERKRLYGKTGVRHSVLMELEYWDPTTMVPVDGMHIFFIGLLQYHARTALLAMGITQDDLKAIWDDIASTVRPRWHAAPPANLGQVFHGKLKADEWRSCFEFDIPVSLLRIETRRGASGTQTDEYRAKLVHSTFLLATAIRWATSYRTSAMHIKKYKSAMKDYLKILRELRPTQRFRPNHLNALLVADYLRLYGPVRGWWMFPFERVIGDLQRTNTNSQQGE
ncbi:hypothetical protein BC826DRAFT_924322 [Russula brevipes]|nr:hypothetical protein BC826DRAFT_924322 [Russula brevipes]